MYKNKNTGRFIVFEGLDGSGQSTMASMLKDYLEQKGFNVVLTKEPTPDSETGKQISEALDKKTKLEPAELQNLFARDRGEHIEQLINPALADGKFVISDRYFFSSMAFGSSDGLDLDWLIRLNDGFLYPDLTFLLKAKPETCIKRIEKRGSAKTLFEIQEKLAKVWETYQILPDRFENIVMIDGEKSVDEVFEQVRKIIEEKLLS